MGEHQCERFDTTKYGSRGSKPARQVYGIAQQPKFVLGMALMEGNAKRNEIPVMNNVLGQQKHSCKTA
jgi:hypothetical protein